MSKFTDTLQFTDRQYDDLLMEKKQIETDRDGWMSQVSDLVTVNTRLQAEKRKLRGPQDLVRVLRIIEYIGPRDKIEDQVARSLNGTMIFGGIKIMAATLGEYPEVLEKAKEVQDGEDD